VNAGVEMHLSAAVLAVAVVLSLCTPSWSAVPGLPVPPNVFGPNNGGHFRFGTVSWVKLQHQPPIIRFTVEAAFRRSFTSTNFKGSGEDGLLVVGDHFKPSGLETIMFDFGDGAMLMPMMFEVQAYSLSEDWVQGISIFEHTYARFSSTTPFQYIGTFKGCCRVSELKVNADTSWSLSSIMNVRDDVSSPRLTVLPVQTVIKKQRPSSEDPAFYIPASDDTQRDHPHPRLKTFEVMGNIGHAPSIIGTAGKPTNLPQMSVHPETGRISLATGAIYSSDAVANYKKCVPGSREPSCRADYNPSTQKSTMNMTNLQPGLYNLVVQLMQGNSSSPVEVMISLVEENYAMAIPLEMPRLSSPTAPDLFYPHLSYARHVSYLGFPMTPFHLSGSTNLQAMQVGFTVGRMPSGARISTIAGGTSAYGFSCVNGTHWCKQSPLTSCNGTSTLGCTCQEPDTEKACRGPHNSMTACRGGGTCQSCWHRGTCPTSTGVIAVEWVPTSGQMGTHMFCFDVTAQRPQEYCSDANEHGCRALSSPSQCVNIDVFKDPAPHIFSSYEQHLDPYAHSQFAYIGRTLTFEVYATDDNCKDTPAITMGPMPPGATLSTQTRTSSQTPKSLVSFFGVNDTSYVECHTEVRTFSWVIPHTYGGYTGRHCFHATDECGEDDHCSGELDTTTLCIDFQVAKCRYAVSLEQSIAEVASIFGTDWIQVFNLNDLASPDYMLFKNQVLNVGHRYIVGVGDTVLKIARRFGLSPRIFISFKSKQLCVCGDELCPLCFRFSIRR